MKNPLGAVLDVQKHLQDKLESGELLHIKNIKDVPNFDEVRNKGASYVNDGTVFVYSNGLSTAQQRGNGRNSKDLVNVGVALSIRTSNTQDLHYIKKLGEAYQSIRDALDVYNPENTDYTNKYLIPDGGSKDAEERHIIGDGFVFIMMNYTYLSIS